MQAKTLKDGEPCEHKGCLNHITHPCEGCGRIGGRTNPFMDRLQEIRDRVDTYSCEDSEFIINSKYDIKYLLEVLEQAQTGNKNLEIDLLSSRQDKNKALREIMDNKRIMTNHYNQLLQSQNRARVLKDEIKSELLKLKPWYIGGRVDNPSVVRDALWNIHKAVGRELDG